MHTRTATDAEPFNEGESMPCHGCRMESRCRADRLACDALAMYMRDVSPIRWRVAPRAPTRARYEVMMERLAA